MIKTFKRVLHILPPRQKQVIGILFVMMLIGAALETISTSMILPIISAATSEDAIPGNKYMRAVYNFLGVDSTNQFLTVLVIALVILYVFKNVYLFFMYYLQYRFVYNGQYNASRALFKEYVNRPYEYFLDASTSKVIRNIVSDVNGTYNLILTYLQLCTEGIVFVALFALSLIASPVMTIIMAIFIGAVLLVNKKILGPIQRRFGHEVRTNSANVTKWLLQAMDGMKETKVLNREKYFVDQYEGSAGRLNMIQRQQQTISNLPRLLVETVIMCGILSMVAMFLSSGDNIGLGSTFGQLALLATVAIRIMPSSNRIITAINNIAYYEPSLNAVEHIIEHAYEIDTEHMYTSYERPASIPFTKEVRFENVTYRYPNTDVDILKDANLTIPLGKSIGLIGPSGAGKSTTVDVLLGLLEPASGKVTVDGFDISENLPGWYNNIGYVPQMMFMLDDSILHNVAYGVPDDQIDIDRVWEVLKEAQIDDYVRSIPEGLNSSIGERGIRISGGQRQRIGIARALYNDPDIMIFDEATSALDNDTEKAIMEAIESLHGRKTLVIVAHRLSTIHNCDAVYKVDNQGFELQQPGTY